LISNSGMHNYFYLRTFITTAIANKMKVSVENREFTIIVEEEPEGRGFSGQCKELPTAISQGKTLKELEENIKDAIQSVLDIQEDRF
jgi:predicted RNase H-like HicB family nuclease